MNLFRNTTTISERCQQTQFNNNHYCKPKSGKDNSYSPKPMEINYNQYVITTKYVINNNSPIIRVIHEDDGDWQFLGKEENLCESDAYVLSLGEILCLDKTLQDVLSLTLGKQAYRTSPKDNWIICDIDD